MSLNDRKIVKIEGRDTVECTVVNDGTNPVLCDADGNVIGHQLEHEGYYYYQGHGTDRVQYVRATFRMTDMDFDK